MDDYTLLAASTRLYGSNGDKDGPARSQLRRLVVELGRGRLWGELCFKELPGPTREALENVGIQEPWQEVDASDNSGLWITKLPDLVDLCEISYLEKSTGKSGKGGRKHGRQ